MADVFQPQVAQINSAVTPRQGVADTSAVELFADVAQVATEATFSYTGQQELGDLKSKFDRVVQARAAGGSSSALQVKARADLDAAKANSPWIAQQADKMFSEAFGGGGSGGVFKATPEEEAQEKHRQKVEETRLALGLSSSEEAQTRIALDERAKSAKLQADAQKDVRQYNGEVVFSNTQAQLNNNSIKFMDSISRAMSLSGGTLSNEDTRNLNLTVDQVALKLQQELNSQTRDPKSGHLLIDKAGYDANLKEIEDWKATTKTMVSDQSYLKVIKDLNTEQNAEINFAATKQYRAFKEIEVAFGQNGVQKALTIAMMPEGAAKELLIKRSPFAAGMFTQQGSFKQAQGTGMDKFFVPELLARPAVSQGGRVALPTPRNVFSEAEAVAVGATLNDPRNSTMMTMVAEKVATDPQAGEAFKAMTEKNPDSSAMFWSDKFKAWKTQNKEKGGVVLDKAMEALKSSFNSAYVSENNKLPEDFNVRMGITGPKGKSTGGSGLFKKEELPRNLVEGEGITYESGSILMNMYKILAANPAMLEELGVETPEDGVKAYVLGEGRSGFTEGLGEEGKLTGLQSLENFLNEPGFLLSEALSELNVGKLQKAMELAKTPEEKAKLAQAIAEQSITARDKYENQPEKQSKATPPKSEATPPPKEESISKEQIEAREAAQRFANRPVSVDVRGRPTDSKVRTTSRTERGVKAIPHGSGAGREPDAEEAKVAVQQAMEVSAEPIDETVGFTEDDLAVMIKSERITEDDAALFRARGLVDKQPVEVTPEIMEQAEKEFDQGELIILNYITKGATREGAIKEIERIGFAGDFTIRWTDAINKVFDFAEGK